MCVYIFFNHINPLFTYITRKSSLTTNLTDQKLLVTIMINLDINLEKKNWLLK